MSRLSPPYRPRRPTETVLYEIVRRHLETFLTHVRKSYDAPLPRCVEDELRGYAQDFLSVVSRADFSSFR